MRLGRLLCFASRVSRASGAGAGAAAAAGPRGRQHRRPRPRTGREGRLRLLTCGGELKDGHRTNNVIFYADLA